MTIVVQDLTALKAADVLNISMIYDKAIFTWTAGDFSGQADDSDIIESDDEPLTAGAWVRQADDSLTFTQGGLGAVRRRVRDKARERVSVQDYLGARTVAEALQAATDYASSVNGEVDLGSGEYVIDPTRCAPNYPAGDPAFGTTLKYAVQMKSNVRYIGRGATIKVADNVSSREQPQNFAIFFSEEALHNIQFQGITIDLNASNNFFSPDPANTLKTQEQRYFRYHQAAIFFDGPAGKADNVLIRDCTFRNGGGVSTIICGRYGAAGAGRRWRILNCNFLELGLDTYDHSSIFLWCDDAVVENCFWRNQSIYAPTLSNRTGINAPIETHGSNTIIANNVFENCNRGSFITENSYGRVECVTFANNIIRNAKYCGVDIAFDGSGGMGAARDIVVRDNTIVLSADDTNLDGDAPFGSVHPCAVAVLGLDSVVAPIERLSIIGNRARRGEGNGRSSNGISIALQAESFDKIRIVNNEFVGFTRGIYLPTIATWATATNYTVKNSRVVHGGSIYRLLIPHTSVDFAGDYDVGKWEFVQSGTTICTDLESEGNRLLDPAGGTLGPAVTKVGVFLLAQGGTIERLYFRDKVLDTRSTNSWAFGIAVVETSPTTVNTFHVAREAVFDQRLAIANQVNGVFNLTLSRVFGVPVTGLYPNTSYGTLSGGAVAASPALPGVSPYDELVVGYDREVTNIGGFLLMPFYSGTDEVSLAVRNVTDSILHTTPEFYFRITAYPGR